MGGSTSSIPELLDLEAFTEVIKELEFLPDCEFEAKDVFDKLSDDDGVYSKSELMKLRTASDVYFAHDWGYDADGRSTHDRVKYLNSECKKKGMITWLDEEREAQTTASMLSPTQLMMDGIRGTQIVMVFITKRYIELVSEEFQQSDLGSIMNTVTADTHTATSPGLQASVAETKAGETNTFAANPIQEEESALGVRWGNADEADGCPNPVKRELLFALRCKKESQTISNPAKRKAPYLKSVVPVIMEESCKDPETWGPILGPALGTRLRLDLSDYEVPSQDLLEAIARAKKEKEREERMNKPKGLLTKKQKAELEAKLKEVRRPRTQIDYLWAGLDEKNVKATGFALAAG